MPHVADIIIHQDPDNNPSLVAYPPGAGRIAHLKACHEVLAHHICAEEIADRVGGLNAPYSEDDLDIAILQGRFTSQIVDTLYESIIDSGRECYLPLFEEIKI